MYGTRIVSRAKKDDFLHLDLVWYFFWLILGFNFVLVLLVYNDMYGMCIAVQKSTILELIYSNILESIRMAK